MSSPGGFSSTKLFVAKAAALRRVIAAFSLIKYPSLVRAIPWWDYGAGPCARLHCHTTTLVRMYDSM